MCSRPDMCHLVFHKEVKEEKNEIFSTKNSILMT